MLSKAFLLALLALVAVSAASSPFSALPDDTVLLDVSSDLDGQSLDDATPEEEAQTLQADLAESEKAEHEQTMIHMDEMERRRFAVLKCEGTVEGYADENRKNRPIILRELQMVKKIATSLTKLVNTYEAPDADVQVSQETKSRREYTETTEINKLMHELDHKLREELRAQRKKLLDAVHSCIHICRDRHYAHRRELLEARETRRKCRRHYHHLERTYFRIKGEYEALLVVYEKLKAETDRHIDVIHREQYYLGILNEKIDKFLARGVKPLETEATTDLEVTQEDTASFSSVMESQHAEDVTEILASMAFLQESPESIERHNKAKDVKKLFGELNAKLETEKSQVAKVLRLKWAEVVKKYNEMMAAFRAMNAYRPVLGHWQAVVADLVQLCDEADKKCSALENWKYLTKTADGNTETKEERRGNADAADQAHKKKMSLRMDHAKLKSEETLSGNKDKATDATHDIKHKAETKMMEEVTEGTSCLQIKERCPACASKAYIIAPPGGTRYSAYCDMHTDGGGWTLIEKTDKSRGTERETTGAVNAAELKHHTINCVAKMDESTANKIGNTFRVLAHGRKFFWRKAPFACTDTQRPNSAGAHVEAKLSWDAHWTAGLVANHKKHGECIMWNKKSKWGTATPHGGEHVCLARWCCGGPNYGIWMNGGNWRYDRHGGYFAGSVWVR